MKNTAERRADMDRKNEKLGIIGGLVGNGIFGFTFMFSRIALRYAQPYVMLFYRFTIAFIVSNIIALAVKGKNVPEWLGFNLKGKRLLPLLLLGLLQPVLYFLFESYGISFTNSTMAGVLISTIPLVALALGRIFLGEKAKPLQILFSVISISGVVLMTVQQSGFGQVRLLGIILLIGAVLSAAYFTVASRRMTDDYSPFERTYVMMGVGMVTFMLISVFSNIGSMNTIAEPLSSPQFVWSVLFLAVIASILGFIALNTAASCLTVSRAASFANLTTVISVFVGTIFLNEPFNALTIIASVLIILGIWGVQKFA